MISRYDAQVFDWLEADDAVAMDVTEMQEEMGEDSVVLCSIDKDLRQVPGWHYNYQYEDFLGVDALFYVDKPAGRLMFFKQLLMGDTSDNIPGIKGVGEKTAERMLADCSTLDEYISVIDTAWKNYNAERVAQELPEQDWELHAKLLFMHRKGEDDNWREWI
jgi:5'-3' exonuclease